MMGPTQIEFTLFHLQLFDYKGATLIVAPSPHRYPPSLNPPLDARIIGAVRVPNDEQ